MRTYHIITVSSFFPINSLLQVPYPAITFDSGSVRNPFGFYEKVLNEVKLDDDGRLQELFFPVLKAIFNKSVMLS